jgi:hypothetical protein
LPATTVFGFLGCDEGGRAGKLKNKKLKLFLSQKFELLEKKLPYLGVEVAVDGV